jgi:16S rRNA (cytosine1402-N4)-methyltransferase
MQLDQGKRGFSFSKEGPLDMRMDVSDELTAKKIVNSWPEKKLGELFRDVGEEPKWRQAAKAIVSARGKKPIETTTDLAEVIAAAMGGQKKRLHPATLIFQALRVCVNRELESIQQGIQKAIQFLTLQGRIGVISFHSLEDRIVKNIFKDASKPIKKFASESKDLYMPLLEVLTKKPLTCSKKEERKNPRARSAKLRFAERI